MLCPRWSSLPVGPLLMTSGEPGRASKSSPGAGLAINTNSDERQLTKIYRPPIDHVARTLYHDSAIRS